MPHVRVRHATEYEYRRPIQPRTHRLMLRPRDSFDLRLRSATLSVSPPAARTRWAHDVFGNTVCYLDWDETATSLLRIVSNLELDHFPSPRDLPLDPRAVQYPFAYPDSELADLAPFLARHSPDPDGAVAAWASRFLPAADGTGTGRTGTLEMLAAMTAGIRAGFSYAMREAEGTQTAPETLRLGSGACRDFALLMMEALRSLGLAARFVSGYLYREEQGQASELLGGGATHAWVAVYLPGAGWIEYDPTNGLIAGRNLVRISSARSPEQAIPVAGSYEGSAGDFLQLRVDVTAVSTRAGATH